MQCILEKQKVQRIMFPITVLYTLSRHDCRRVSAATVFFEAPSLTTTGLWQQVPNVLEGVAHLEAPRRVPVSREAHHEAAARGHKRWRTEQRATEPCQTDALVVVHLRMSSGEGVKGSRARPEGLQLGGKE